MKKIKNLKSGEVFDGEFWIAKIEGGRRELLDEIDVSEDLDDYELLDEEELPFEEVAKPNHELQLHAGSRDEFATRDGLKQKSVLRIADRDYYEILPDGTKKTEFTWDEAMKIEKKTHGKWRVPTQAESLQGKENKMTLRLKDKQTGEVDEYYLSNDPGYGVINASTGTFIGFDTLAELNEKFEDAHEEKKYGGRVPKVGNEFWFIMCDGAIIEGLWDGVEYDKARFKTGSASWTKEEAERELARREAYVILKEDTKGFKPNWKNYDERKYYLAYSHDLGEFTLSWNRHVNSGDKLYFATEEDAKASVKAHEKEWKTWLGVEDGR